MADIDWTEDVQGEEYRTVVDRVTYWVGRRAGWYVWTAADDGPFGGEGETGEFSSADDAKAACELFLRSIKGW